jgi:hypothetical protein
MYHGSCLCGKVEYQITGVISDLVMCHCSQCRRAQGSAFATNGNVLNEEFKMLSGADNLTEFKEGSGRSKFFCKTCGSPIFAKIATQPQYTRIRLGLIQEDVSEKIEKHIFVDSKANWDILPDDGITRCSERD